MSESLREFWTKAHTERSIGSLSGFSGEVVWGNLDIQNLIVPGAIVLNIGVGTGLCTRELVQRGCKVHVLDICEKAFESVSDVVEEVWLAEFVEDLPPNTFDLAISHLVCQHMNSKELEEQIRCVLRSLKPSGIFAMQFSCSLKGLYQDGLETEEMQLASIPRSLAHMDNMIQSAGGEIVWARLNSRHLQAGFGWYGIHIKRRTDE